MNYASVITIGVVVLSLLSVHNIVQSDPIIDTSLSQGSGISLVVESITKDPFLTYPKHELQTTTKVVPRKVISKRRSQCRLVDIPCTRLCNTRDLSISMEFAHHLATTGCTVYRCRRCRPSAPLEDLAKYIRCDQARPLASALARSWVS